MTSRSDARRSPTPAYDRSRSPKTGSRAQAMSLGESFVDDDLTVRWIEFRRFLGHALRALRAIGVYSPNPARALPRLQLSAPMYSKLCAVAARHSGHGI